MPRLASYPSLAAITLTAFVAVTAGLRAQDADPFARWEKAIAAFEKQDAKEPPPKDAILFVGSSSIRLWDLKKSFPDLQVINRGFGGSQMADSVHFAPQIILKHRPRVVVVYAGDNDIAAGKSPEQLLKGFQQLVKVIRAALPDTTIIFLPVKPSIRRWELFDVQTRANRLIEKFCSEHEKLKYLDIVTPMLGKDGRPRPELFAADGLHLSPAGYELWSEQLRPLLR